MSKVFVMLFFMTTIACVRGAESFADNSAKRQQQVQSLSKQAASQKKIAVDWADKNGIPVMIDNGFQKMELMRLENNKPLYYITYNVDAAISAAADEVRGASPFNVIGSNIVVGIWDGGSVLQTHQEFTDDRVVLKNVVASHYHATHVGGTIGAAGVVNNAKGMAPYVTIHSYDWYDDVAEMTAVAASYPAEINTIYLSNHSYGYVGGWNYNGTSWTWYGHYADGLFGPEYGFGQYMSVTREYDDLVYNAPYYLPFKAAGNDRDNGPPSAGTTFSYYFDYQTISNKAYNVATDPAGDGLYKNGYDTIGYVGNAKNILTVGAVNPAVSGGERSLVNATMSSFSSWGPADDGRIKPDVVADGVGVYSTYNSSDTAYATMSGTSMSTPSVCGSAALLIDLYGKYFSTNSAMRASTLKGLIIHTADDIGRQGPDYINGWGLVNMKSAAYILKSLDDGDNIRLAEAELNTSTDQSGSYKFYSDGSQLIRVTLCWTDPPGTSTTANDSRTPVLVNDLDLKLISGTTTNYPYSLSYTYPTSNATYTAENNIDNVEQVYIETPTPGDYTILVDYDGILTNSEQWFSLIVSGNIKQGSMLIIR
jgi:hypothetical protein